MILKGVDFSHWQSGKMDSVISDCDFFIHKLTEGEKNVDPSAGRRIKTWCERKPTIVYHFLKDSNNYQKEISHFIDTFNATGYAHTLGACIDYETDTQANISAIEKAMYAIESILEVRPILYCGDVMSRELYQMIRTHDWGLWIARYRSKPPEHICDFWQCASTPYDKDVFYGDFEKLKTFIGRWKA